MQKTGLSISVSVYQYLVSAIVYHTVYAAPTIKLLALKEFLISTLLLLPVTLHRVEPSHLRKVSTVLLCLTCFSFSNMIEYNRTYVAFALSNLIAGFFLSITCAAVHLRYRRNVLQLEPFELPQTVRR